ncbi:hypothetical protein EDD15DRAFT_306116 [Pisolithus albus]|nr:hypothetical protein EDD15DRAFT_306116 [Pisolithus albus]
MHSTPSPTNTMHLQKLSSNLKPTRLHNSDSGSPVLKTTSGPPTLPHIDTGPSIKKLLLPDEQSLSDMRIPPIEPVDPAIHVPLLLDTAEERHNSSENVIGKCGAVSLISQAREHTAHAHLAGYRLSKDSGVATTNPPFSEHPEHRDGKTIANNNLSRPSSLSMMHSTTARTPNIIRTEFPTRPSQPLHEKRRNNVTPTFPTFKKIRQFLAPSRDRLPLTQRAVCIAPAQCAEPVVVSPTRDRSRPTNPSSPPGEVIPLPDDGQSTITTNEDGTRGCCSFLG